MIYVENVSAKQKKKKNNTRFFSEKKNPLRQDGYTKKARERKKIAHGLGVPAFVKSPPNTPPLAARLFIIKGSPPAFLFPLLRKIFRKRHREIL